MSHATYVSFENGCNFLCLGSNDTAQFLKNVWNIHICDCPMTTAKVSLLACRLLYANLCCVVIIPHAVLHSDEQSCVHDDGNQLDKL